MTINRNNTACHRSNSARTGACNAGSIDNSPMLHWEFATAGNVFSSPAMADGIVCFASRDKHVYAVDVETGGRRWRFATTRGISTSPAIAGGVAFAGGEDGILYALDLYSGEPRWQFNAGYPIGSSPAICNGRVYFGCGGVRPVIPGGALYAVDMADGRPLWRRESSLGFYSPPTITERLVLCGNRDGTLYATDHAGRLQWTFDTYREIVSTTAYAHGLAYLTSCDGHLYALETVTGQCLWQHYSGASLMDSSVAVANERVYLGDRNGQLSCLHAVTGKVIWTGTRCNPGNTDNTGEPAAFGSPAIAGDTLYCGCSDGYIYAFDANSGTLRWRYHLGAGNWTSPALADGMLCIGGGFSKNVYLLRSGD